MTLVIIISGVCLGIAVLSLSALFLLSRSKKAEAPAPTPTAALTPMAAPTAPAVRGDLAKTVAVGLLWIAGAVAVLWVIRGIGESCLREYRLTLTEQRKAQSGPRVAASFSSVPAVYNAGNKYFRLGRYEEALHYYSRALEINPRHWKSWYNRAYTYGEMGMYHEAVGNYKRALEIEPYHPDSWYNFGVNCENTELVREAIYAFENFLKYVSPDDPRIATARRKIENMENPRPILKIPEKEERVTRVSIPVRIVTEAPSPQPAPSLPQPSVRPPDEISQISAAINSLDRIREETSSFSSKVVVALAFLFFLVVGMLAATILGFRRLRRLLSRLQGT